MQPPAPQLTTNELAQIQALRTRLLEAESPFVAGGLSRERVVRILAARAPSIDWETRVPQFPLEFDQWTEAPLIPAPRSATPTMAPDELEDFEVLRLSGALRPLRAEERDRAIYGKLFFVDQTPPSAAISTPPGTRVVASGTPGRRKLRLIFDCRRLNSQLKPTEPFPLDDIFSVPHYLSVKGARLLGKVDLQSAYFQLAVQSRDHPLLACVGPDGREYAWTCMPMGLSHAPRLFQQLTACFRDAWRAAGATASVYLDDFLLGGTSSEDYIRTASMVVGDLLDAGWRIREAKCQIPPSACMKFLGIDVDAVQHTLAIPAEKVEYLVRMAAAWSSAERVPLGELETWLGRASFARICCPRIGFFMVHLYRCVPAESRPQGWDSDEPPARHRLRQRTRSRSNTTTASLSEQAREELLWWSQASDRLSRPRPWDLLAEARVWSRRSHPPPSDSTSTAASDASDSGFAGSCIMGSQWSVDRKPFIADLLPPNLIGASSCARELYAAARTIGALPSAIKRGATIRFVMDAQSSVASAVRGTACRGTVEAARLLDTAIEARDLTVIFEWAPRACLEAEDAMSRDAVRDGSNAQIHRTDLLRLTRDMGLPTRDVFASHATRVCDDYGSRWGGAGSLGDGFSVLASASRYDRLWIFPPFSLALPALTAAIKASSLKGVRCVAVLPDRPAVRAIAQAAGWYIAPGPRSIRYPDGSIRAPPIPLLAIAPPSSAPPS